MKLTPPVEPTIPGASATSESGLRPLFGTDWMRRFSITCPKAAEVTLSSGAVPATSREVATDPTVSFMSRLACCCTSRSNGAWMVFSKPGASTDRLYLAGGNPGNM